MIQVWFQEQWLAMPTWRGQTMISGTKSYPISIPHKDFDKNKVPKLQSPLYNFEYFCTDRNFAIHAHST